ncbi:MAG: PEP-CTERM sorting domain-containing protein [Terriglobia bacterium]
MGIRGAEQSFSEQGPISINMAVTNTHSNDLAYLTGTGTAAIDLIVDLSPPLFTRGTFMTSGNLTGDIIYNFNPSDPAPQPGSLTLLLVALGGFALIGLNRRRKASKA